MAGFSHLSLRMEADRQLHRLAFSASDLNRMERGSLLQVGNWYIGDRLALRFSDYARTDLGYTAQVNNPWENDAKRLRGEMSRALSSGLVDRLAQQFWQGWNPWKSWQVPGPLWDQLLRQEQAAGRFHKSRSGYFATLKREFRRHVKADLRRRVRELSAAGEVNEKRPLVSTGKLEQAALSGATARATATASAATLTISIPAPARGAGEKAIYHPMVRATIQRLTTDEVAEAEQVYGRAYEGYLAGAEVRVVSRGANAGQQRRALTGEQRSSIANLASTPLRALPERASIAS